MSFIRGAKSPSAAFSSTSTITGFDCGTGTGRIVLVFATCDRSGTAPSSATVGGVAMTAGTIITRGDTNTQGRLFWLSGPTLPEGAQNVVTTYSNSSAYTISAVTVRDGAAASAPVSAEVTGYRAHANTPTGWAVASAADEQVVLMGFTDNTAGTVTVNAPSTERFNNTATGFYRAYCWDAPGSAGTVTVAGSCTGTTPAWWGTVVSIRPYSAAPSDTIAETLLWDGHIAQRSGTTGTLALGGTWTGTQPTAVQAQIVQDGTSTVVVDWTTVDAAPSAGGTWAGSLTGIPQGGMYNVRVREANNTAIYENGTKKVGVGGRYAAIGQSNARKLVSDGTGTPHAATRKYSGSAGSGWNTNTGAGSIAIANALQAALGIPIAILDYGKDGSSLVQAADSGGGWWLNTAANSPYDLFKAGVNSIGGKLEGVIWDQGQRDGDAAVAQATYKAGLDTLFARIRTDFSLPNLPIFIAPVGRYTGGGTDAGWQGVRDAQYQAAADTNNYLALQTYDVELAVDGVHYSTGSNGFLRYGTRVGLRIKEVLGLTTNSRGPYIVSASRVNSTTIDVTFALRGGTTITPASGVTILRVVDGAGTNAVVSVTRLTATKMRVVVTSAMTGTVIVQAAYGVNPTVTTVIYDDSANTLPLEGTSAAGIAVTRKQATLTLVDRNNTPQANVTGLYGAWFDNPRLDQLVAPTDVFSGLSTDGSGVLTVDIPNSALTNGQVGRLHVDKSDGTTTQSPTPIGGGGPVVVTVV